MAATVALHSLCRDCTTFCSRSKILNNTHAWQNKSASLKNALRRDLLKDLTTDYFGSREMHAFTAADERRIQRLIERNDCVFTPIALESKKRNVKHKRQGRVFSDNSSTGGSGDEEVDEAGDLLATSHKGSVVQDGQISRSSSEDSILSASSVGSEAASGDLIEGETSGPDSDVSGSLSGKDGSKSGSSDCSQQSTVAHSEASSYNSSDSEQFKKDRKPPYLRGLKPMEVLLDSGNARVVTLGKLLKSATQGCHLCSLLLPCKISQGEDANLPNLKREDARRVVKIACSVWSPVGHVFICSTTSSEEWIERVLRVRQQKDPASPSEQSRSDGIFHDVPLAFDLENPSDPARDSTNTSAEAIFPMIKSWLHKCQTSHVACGNAATHPGKLPTRLLDLGVSTGDEYINLHITDAQIDERIPYVALSHCWGNVNTTQLTKDSLADFTKGMLISKLPKTFQHAIGICRKVHVRYLWIDSLCIINDDRDDWEREASAMADVYSNCIWSLAALRGSNSEAGCFARREPKTYLPCKLPGKFRLYAEAHEIMNRRNQRPRKFQGKQMVLEAWANDVDDDAPLLRRAWVVQEQLLAPRTVYFGARHVHWECRTCEANDICPNANIERFRSKGVLDAMLGGQTRSPENVLVIAPPMEPRSGKQCSRRGHDVSQRLSVQAVDDAEQSDNREHTQGQDGVSHRRIARSVAWSTLVAHYTSKSLTYQEDKLKALQGIISLFQNRTGMTPFFGMWKETILDELLWKREVGSGIGGVTHAAPSFSWASVDCGVLRMRDWCHEPAERQCQIADVRSDGGTFGNGYVQVSATLIEMWEFQIPTKTERFGDVICFEWKSKALCGEPRKRTGHKLFVTLDHKDIDERKWYLMPMATFDRSYREKATHGLVLQQQNAKMNEFIRIGAFESASSPYVPQWWDTSSDENPYQFHVAKRGRHECAQGEDVGKSGKCQDWYNEGESCPEISNKRSLPLRTPTSKELLGKLLYDHIRGEFPTLVQAIRDFVLECRQEIDQLGSPRQTTVQQRQYLTRIAAQYQDIVTSILEGDYDTLVASRQDRVAQRLKKLGRQYHATMVPLVTLTQTTQASHLGNEDQAIYDIHDILKSYYKVAFKRFVDEVVMQAVERYCMTDDGPVKFISPRFVAELTEDDHSDIVQESYASSSTRAETKLRLERLEKALAIAEAEQGQ